MINPLYNQQKGSDNQRIGVDGQFAADHEPASDSRPDETDKEQIILAADLRMVISRLVKKMRSQSSIVKQLSLTERSVMKQLDQHTQLLPSELAVMEKITTQSMSQILQHLSALGYISRTASTTDKRKVIISLSAAGSEVLHQTRNEHDERLGKAIRENWTADEQAMLRRLIGPLNRLLD